MYALRLELPGGCGLGKGACLVRNGRGEKGIVPEGWLSFPHTASARTRGPSSWSDMSENGSGRPSGGASPVSDCIAIRNAGVWLAASFAIGVATAAKPRAR